MTRLFEQICHSDFVCVKHFLKNIERYPDNNALTCTTCNQTWSYVELNRE